MGKYLSLCIGGNEINEIHEIRSPTVTREAEDLRELLEERCGILEHDAGLPRPEAELEAARIMATLARNRGCLWGSLRAALSGHPALLAQIPDKAGPVDALPLGVATVAVLKDKNVVKQGVAGGGPTSPARCGGEVRRGRVYA
jgi:hypothetical protein